MNHVGPGKEFELGMDSWECGGKQVETICFLSGPHTLREFYQRSFAEHAEKEFIVYGDERYTYAQVEHIIKTLAHSLVEQLGKFIFIIQGNSK